MTPNERYNLILERLKNAFAPTLLILEDESGQHKGHVGAQGGASHFALEISSSVFKNKPLLECHRLIYALFTELIPEEIHALKIKITS